jgi:hypothetical protein
MPSSSAAAMTSSSRTEPPGWTMATIPAAASASTAVTEREERVARGDRALLAATGPLDAQPDAVDTAHLTRTDTDDLAVAHHHDRVR